MTGTGPLPDPTLEAVQEAQQADERYANAVKAYEAACDETKDAYSRAKLLAQRASEAWSTVRHAARGNYPPTRIIPPDVVFRTEPERLPGLPASNRAERADKRADKRPGGKGTFDMTPDKYGATERRHRRGPRSGRERRRERGLA